MNTTSSEVKSIVNQNAQTLDVLPAEELVEIHRRYTSGTTTNDPTATIKASTSLGLVALDLPKAQRIIRELGLTGRVKVVTHRSKQYVIFKGNPRSRSILTGTRYSASNPKVVDMAIGRRGVNKAIASGARISIFFTVPVNILTHIISDDQTKAEFLSAIATDIAKASLVAAIASVAGSATAAVTTIAAGPIVVVIAAGISATIGLDALDRRFGITETLANELQEAYDDTVGEINRQAAEVNRRLKWQILNGRPVGQGIFY
ncbi:hypothetical protein [Marinimicrobium locisalis]|uniref:hypothetical protein n=1 Tax=Marinimicrobium locisalis TaxID=546022 RepID=UPI003221BEDE